MKQRGTTIIEVLIYLALFGTLMGGVIVASFNLYESNYRTQAIINTVQESTFIMNKISWTLSQQLSIEIPSLGSTDSKLRVRIEQNAVTRLVTIFESNNTLFMHYESDIPIPITSSSVTVRDVEFSYVKSSMLSKARVEMRYKTSAPTKTGLAHDDTFTHEFYIHE